MAKSPTSKFLTVRDASRLFCEVTQTSREPHRSLFYRLMTRGAIRGVRSGGRVLIEAESLREHLRPRPIQPTTGLKPSHPAAGIAAAARLRSVGINTEGVN